MRSSRLVPVIAVVVAGLVAAGCATDPRASEEFRELEAELDEVRDELAAAEEARGELESQLQEAWDAAADRRILERQLEVAREEVEELLLRFDGEIRAELREEYDAAVAAACEEASDDPSRPVERFVTFDDRWSQLNLDEEQMVDDVAACAGPARDAAQLTRADAVAALGPVGRLVLDAYREGSQPDDLEEQLRDAVGEITRGAVVEDPDADWVEALERLETGHHCSFLGCTVVSLLDELVELGVEGMPAMTMFGGSMRVGTADGEAAPGTWTTYAVRDCYWERLDATGSIIANNFVMAAPQVQVTISASDFAFNSRGCGRWLRF